MLLRLKSCKPRSRRNNNSLNLIPSKADTGRLTIVTTFFDYLD